MSEGSSGESQGARFRASRRQFLLGGAFLASAVVAFVRKPRQHERSLGASKIEDLVPKEFANWQFIASSGLVLPPEDQLRDETYSQLLTRTYAHRNGTAVMLLIAYSASQDGTIQVHRPEVCYPASGYRLVQTESHLVPLTSAKKIPSRYIVADADLRREQIIYWTRLGNAFPREWSEQRLAVFRQNLAGVIPDGILVRISTIAAENSEAILDAFASDLYHSVGAKMKRVLIGDI